MSCGRTGPGSAGPRSARSLLRERSRRWTPGNRIGLGSACAVTDWYSQSVPRREVVLSYDEAMAVCLLLAEAADASLDMSHLPDTWAEEARLMIEMILNRTDD